MTDEYGAFDFGPVGYGNYGLAVSIGGETVYEQVVDVTDWETDVPITVEVDGVTNLIPNPAWEGAPDLPIGWFPDSSRSIVGQVLVFQPDPDHSERWVLTIDDEDNLSHALRTEKIPALPDTTYQASVTARTDGQGGRATLYLQFFDEIGKRIGHENKHYSGAEWKLVFVEMIAPAGAVSMDVMLYSSSSIVGTASFRKVVLGVQFNDPR